jgi:hypothetical protein
LILGESGSGKSASLRNFNETDKICVMNVASKPLPFRKKLPSFNTPNYDELLKRINYCAGKRNIIVIDDAQYLMCFESFAKAKDIGYGKFTDMALHFYNLVQYVIQNLPQDTIVYFLQHTDTDSNTGKVKAKTVGKMLDSQLTLEGLFSIVLFCTTDGKNHHFVTQSDGDTTAKSPMEMFPLTIDNDLKMVDNTIREYYGFNTKEENKNDSKT